MQVKAYSVSLSQGRAAELHDKRYYIPANVEPSLIGENVSIVRNEQSDKQTFNDFFAPAIARYNEKQKREDRKKDFDYWSGIENGIATYGKGKQKENTVYEYVLQIGNRKTLGVTDESFDVKKWRELKKEKKYDEAAQYVREHLNASTDKKILKEVLTDYCKTLVKRYPSLKFHAIEIHADEPDGTIHAHIRFTPVVEGSKTGLDTRVGLVGALRAMGFKNTRESLALTKWQNDLKAGLVEAMEGRGYERQFMGNEEEHIANGRYQEIRELEDQIEDLEMQRDILEVSIGRMQKRTEDEEKKRAKAEADRVAEEARAKQLKEENDQLVRTMQEAEKASRSRCEAMEEETQAKIEKAVREATEAEKKRLTAWDARLQKWQDDIYADQEAVSEREEAADKREAEHSEAMRLYRRKQAEEMSGNAGRPDRRGYELDWP